MAEVNVEKHSSGQNRGQSSQTVQRQQGPGLTRRGDIFSSPFFSRPSDLFAMNPFALMRRLSDEMDRAFYGPGGSELQAWSPAVDVTEREGNLVIHADLPGLNKEDVKIDVTEDT